MSLLIKKILEKIKNLNSRLKTIEDKTIIKNGKRERFYLIGKQNANSTGPGNAGQLTLFVNNIGIYQNCIPAYFMVNRNGECFKHSIGTESGALKQIITYTNNTYNYIFLYAPNYHDNYFVDVVANYNVTLDIQEMTSEDFNSFITGMEKISQA